MSSPVNPQVLEAAQALCMLARGNPQQEDMNMAMEPQGYSECTITHVLPVVKREQEEDRDETADDCVVTHSRPTAPGQEDESAIDVRVTIPRRPIVNRHHPYRRPEPQQVQVSVFVDSPRMLHDQNLDGEWLESALRLLQEVPRLSRGNGRDERPSPSQTPAPVQSPASVQSPAPVQSETHISQNQPPIQSPSPAELERPHLEANTNPGTPYAPRALCLQALLTAPPGEWMTFSGMLDCLSDKYPEVKEQKRRHGNPWANFSEALTRMKLVGTVEKLVQPGSKSRWRIPAEARQRATEAAWQPNRRGTPRAPVGNHSRSASRGPASSEPASPEPVLPRDTRSATRAAPGTSGIRRNPPRRTREKVPVGRQLRGRFVPE